MLKKTKEVYNELLDRYHKSDTGVPITDSDLKMVKDEIKRIEQNYLFYKWLSLTLIAFEMIRSFY